MRSIANPYRGTGLKVAGIPAPSVNADAPRALLAQCPAHGVTPLVQALGMKIKDERGRMGLGSFKALGAAYVIAQDAQNGDVSSRTYVTASAGNHGLSVAAGAKAFGAKAVIYLSETVPESFVQRLRDKGAETVIEGEDYEASMGAAAMAAQEHSWTLLSDSSWKDYTDMPHRVMEGYLVLAVETAEQIDAPPTHIFLQAGVGGLAGAAAAYFRHVWGDSPEITVVEPEYAPALHDGIVAGRFVITSGPVSEMGRLDCKEASLIALKGLSRDADRFALITEDEAQAVLPELAAAGMASTASGAAGIAAARLSDLPEDARVLCILSEGV